MIDVNKLNGILNIVLFSSLLSLAATFFCLWFLSKWAEIKEMLKNLTQKIDQKFTSEIKNEKLTSLYVENKTLQKQTLESNAIVVESTIAPTTSTTNKLPDVIFAEDILDKETIISKYKTVKITTTEPTTTEPTTTDVTTTSKSKTLEESTQEIKDIIKKRKTKNETSK